MLNQQLSSNPLPVAQLAQIFKASGDALRAEIIRVLKQDSFSVQELCQVFSIRQPAMSHHLKVLSSAGLVTTRREGNTIFYRRAIGVESAQPEIAESIFSAIDSAEISEQILSQLEAIRVERASRSQKFFNLNAERFREQQDLIASFDDYGESILRLIDSVPVAQNSSAIDVGCGLGELLEGLSKRFKSVVGIDISETILDSATAHIETLGLSNVSCLQADPSELIDQQHKADLVTCNMVLHHTSSPQQVVEQLAQLVADGGTLLVTDLCQHDQDWARASCGDQWLGFEPQEIISWASAAGFSESKSQYLSLRNGFRIQLHLFSASGSIASDRSNTIEQ